MSSQASQISSDESMKDCLSETELRPVDAELHDDDSQISLHSCNSSETLKQWTMHYPVTACCQSAAGATSSKRRRSRKKRSRRRSSDADTSDDDMMIYVGSNGQVNCCKKVCCPRKPCTSTKKRLSDQSKDAAHCLLSDSDSSRNKQLLSPKASNVDVDDRCPTKVDLLSCNSSFSDCSLPCHELVTYSEAHEPLPKGLVKVSVRPPQCVEPCVYCGPCGPCLCVPCTDRDRYDIKFVSHLVDQPRRARIRKITIPFVRPPLRIRVPTPPPTPDTPTPVPSIEPDPESPVQIITPSPSITTPTVSEESLTIPTTISEPPPIIEEIPSLPLPPTPPVVSEPSIVEPGVLGVSGTQVITRCRKHYGDLCKLIRCSKPCRPCCQPCTPPCEQPPCQCDYCVPYESCDYLVPYYQCNQSNGNQSNSCSSHSPRKSCYPSASYCDEDLPCDRCSLPCKPCPPPCRKAPRPPCCRPCCKVTWLRSITTKPLKFTHVLMTSKMVASATGLDYSDEFISSSSMKAMNASLASVTNESTFDDSESIESPTHKPKVDNETRQCSDDDDDSATRNCGRKPADPWKRPPDMEQQTFERYVNEIVRTLEPAIPSNPFAVARETSTSAETDCERIRIELEQLLSAVDHCYNSTPSCLSTPAAVRSGCWPC